MGDWGDEAVRDDALLLLTEVVANGVSHAGSAMRVRLSVTRELLRAEVSDDSPLAPHRRVADEVQPLVALDRADAVAHAAVSYALTRA